MTSTALVMLKRVPYDPRSATTKTIAASTVDNRPTPKKNVSREAGYDASRLV
jgi:hypothetical protein